MPRNGAFFILLPQNRAWEGADEVIRCLVKWRHETTPTPALCLPRTLPSHLSDQIPTEGVEERDGRVHASAHASHYEAPSGDRSA
jgi:hypothetical protein